MRRLAPVVALCFLAACGSPETERPVASGSGPPPASETTRAPATTAADAAPDFSLELGNGGTFVLSEEARPVFMVFWAEW